MKRSEKIKAAANHMQTDYVPYNISFTKHEYDKVVTYLRDEAFREKIGNLFANVYYDGYIKEVTP